MCMHALVLEKVFFCKVLDSYEANYCQCSCSQRRSLRAHAGKGMQRPIDTPTEISERVSIHSSTLWSIEGHTRLNCFALLSSELTFPKVVENNMTTLELKLLETATEGITSFRFYLI